MTVRARQIALRRVQAALMRFEQAMTVNISRQERLLTDLDFSLQQDLIRDGTSRETAALLRLAAADFRNQLSDSRRRILQLTSGGLAGLGSLIQALATYETIDVPMSPDEGGKLQANAIQTTTGVGQAASLTPDIILQGAIDCLRAHRDEFNVQHWLRLSPDERKDALTSLALDFGLAVGAPVRGVGFFQAPPCHRGKYCGDGYLYLNSDVLADPDKLLDVLDTIFHEGRHAMQLAAIRDPDRYPFSVAVIAAWRWNYDHYIRPADDPVGYFNQAVERDAREYAATVIREGMKERRDYHGC